MVIIACDVKEELKNDIIRIEKAGGYNNQSEAMRAIIREGRKVLFRKHKIKNSSF
jgi:hypothetical protein